MPGKATIRPSDEKQVSTKPPPPLAGGLRDSVPLLYVQLLAHDDHQSFSFEDPTSADAPLERFVVKDKKRIFFVPVSNVLWIEATGNYACIHTASDSHLLRETLARLEEKLAPHYFIRVRKSAIVNGDCISEIRPMFDGVYDIVLAEGTVVTSSRRYAHKLRALLET